MSWSIEKHGERTLKGSLHKKLRSLYGTRHDDARDIWRVPMRPILKRKNLNRKSQTVTIEVLTYSEYFLID